MSLYFPRFNAQLSVIHCSGLPGNLLLWTSQLISEIHCSGLPGDLLLWSSVFSCKGRMLFAARSWHFGLEASNIMSASLLSTLTCVTRMWRLQTSVLKGGHVVLITVFSMTVAANNVSVLERVLLHLLHDRNRRRTRREEKRRRSVMNMLMRADMFSHSLVKLVSCGYFWV